MDSTLEVRSPYDDRVVGTVPLASADMIDEIVRRARTGAAEARNMSRGARGDILDRASRIVERDAAAFAALVSSEAGKPIRQARKEVARCANTLRLSAEEARRNGGELIPFGSFAGSERRQGWFSREPLGIIAAITPYNDPLNLVAHKLGPAIAGGNGVILKPSELTPLSALRLTEAFEEAGLPSGVVTVAVGDGALGQAIVASRDVRMVSFTGGFATGERIAARAGLKKLAMDLGGNAPVIVMADADLPHAVAASVSGAYWAAGQNCVGTQRIFVQRSVYEAFRSSFISRTEALTVGDPAQETTDVGPLISFSQLESLRERVDMAIASGARVLTGHRTTGRCYHPTVLEDVPHDCSIWRDEVFAPVVTLEPFDELDAALVLANGPEYALHAGIFTRDIETALRAADEIEAGGIMINDSSDYRFDAMPFGGYKYGSMGREGVRFAYEEMTQTKVVCLSRG